MVAEVMAHVIGFNRHETSCLIGVDYHDIVYLERIGMVEVQKLGGFKKGAPIYTLRQLVSLMIADKYRKSFKKEELKLTLAFIENNLAVLTMEDTCVVCFSLKSKTSDENIVSVGYIKIGDNVMHTIQELAKEHDEKGLEATPESKWNINIEVISPIREFIEQIIKNAKACPDIDYNDFLQRAGLEGF